MGPRAYRRNQGIHRKTIGAVVIAGVLVAAGITGVQLASAETAPQKKAAGLINVDGQQFDVADCAELQVNAGSVVCDGEELAPVEQQAPGDAAAASAQALGRHATRSPPTRAPLTVTRPWKRPPRTPPRAAGPPRPRTRPRPSGGPRR